MLDLLNPEVCLICKSDKHTKVIDSEPRDGGRWRRRKCAKCNERWNTNERRCDAEDVVRILSQLTAAVDEATANLRKSQAVLAEALVKAENVSVAVKKHLMTL